MQLFTIGHSNHEIASFMLLLKKHNITALADVRSHPYSRFLKHFNQSILSNALKSEGIYYVFLGKELGARPSSEECYVNGKALYEKIAKTSAFNHGIERILQGVKKQRIALMCAEKDPIECHRAILVCQHLRHCDLDIYHILKNGDLESHDHLEERMGSSRFCVISLTYIGSIDLCVLCVFVVRSTPSLGVMYLRIHFTHQTWESQECCSNIV